MPDETIDHGLDVDLSRARIEQQRPFCPENQVEKRLLVVGAGGLPQDKKFIVVRVHAELRRSRAIRASCVPRLSKTSGFQSRLLALRCTTRGREGRNEQKLNSAIPARRTAASKPHSQPQSSGRGAPGRNADHVRGADDGASTTDRPE